VRRELEAARTAGATIATRLLEQELELVVAGPERPVAEARFLLEGLRHRMEAAGEDTEKVEKVLKEVSLLEESLKEVPVADEGANDERARRTFKQTHTENRNKICVLCWRKAPEIKVRLITSKVAVMIREHTHHHFYNVDNQLFPAGICLTDLSKLHRIANNTLRGTDPREEWSYKLLSDIAYPEDGVGGENCSCPMCHLGSYNPVGKAGHRAIREKPVMNPEGGKLEAEKQPVVSVKKKVLPLPSGYLL